VAHPQFDADRIDADVAEVLKDVLRRRWSWIG